MKEIWKDIEGYEGLYQVSSMGNVKSIDRVINRKNGTNVEYKGRNLKPIKQRNGYLTVGLSKNNNIKTITIHRLVAIAFLKKIKDYNIINHLNNNKKDNRCENLEWCTQRHNVQHSIKNGNRNLKVKVIFNDEEKQNIKDQYENSKITQRELAKKYRVSQRTIGRVLRDYKCL